MKKNRDVQHVKKYQVPIFILTEDWKLKVDTIKVAAKKKKTIGFMHAKPKTLKITKN